MKNIKLLTTLSPALIGFTTIIPISTITSCNKGNSNITLTYIGKQNEWVSPGSTISLKFKLNKALENGQKLKGPLFPPDAAWTFHNTDFDGDTEWTVSGTEVTGVQKFKNYQSSIGDAYITVDKLKFSVWDTNGVTIAYAFINNFKVRKLEFEDYNEAVKNYLKAYRKYENVKLTDQNDKILCKKA